MGERPQKNAVKRLTSRIGGATRKESPMIAMHRPSSGELLQVMVLQFGTLPSCVRTRHLM